MWEHERYCDAAEAEIGRLAEVIAGADFTVPVPTCPGWTLGELVLHTGEVNRWAGAMVRDRAGRRYRREDLRLDKPDDLAELPRWLADGGDALIKVLRDAAPGEPVWTWGGPQNAGWWARRMVHETGVHRADAEFALGRRPEFIVDQAVDGVDEFLANLPYVVAFSPLIAELRGSGETIGLRARDTDAVWRIELTAGGFTWGSAESAADVTVRATAPELLLFVSGRRGPGDPGIEVSGDAGVLAHWIENSVFA